MDSTLLKRSTYLAGTQVGEQTFGDFEKAQSCCNANPDDSVCIACAGELVGIGTDVPGEGSAAKMAWRDAENRGTSSRVIGGSVFSDAPLTDADILMLIEKGVAAILLPVGSPPVGADVTEACGKRQCALYCLDT